MPLSFHTRLTDTQVAAIDAATRIVDPRTGLLLTVSRQEVVSSILDAWIAQHAPLPPVHAPLAIEDLPAIEVEPEPALEPSVAARQALPPESPAPLSTLAVQPEPSLADIGPPGSDPAAPVPVPAVVQGKLALAERVRALRHQGMSYPKIVALFNDEAIPTLSGHGHWSNSSVVKLETFGL